MQQDIIEIAQSIAELLQMCADDQRSPYDEERSPFLETNRQRVREIGEKLNSNYGFDGMAFVFQHIPLADQRELEYCWHEIGDWQC